jgi:TRAP-type C4-dicarboxylate transport system permease small subunit
MNSNTGAKPSSVQYWLGVLPSQVLGVIACVLLFAMMLLTFIDVGGRYLFSAPLPAAYELISLIMPGIIFCALPHVCRTSGHVTIDLLDSFMSPRAERVQRFATSLVSAGALGFIAWRLYAISVDQKRFGQVTDELYLPQWPISLIMSILCAIATLSLVANVFDSLFGRDDTPMTGDETL